MQELEWMSSHPKEMEKYSGKWIAVTNKGIVAAGNSLSEVSDAVKKMGAHDVMFMKVPRKDEELSIL